MTDRAAPSAGQSTTGNRFERSLSVWDRTLATITALALVTGGIWTAWTYLRHQKEELHQKRQEYLLQLRKEKRELYQPLCTVAARIATASTMRAAAADVAQFWELYWGQVHFIADDGFQNAKERFRDELMECLERADQPPSGELRNRSHELAMAVQRVIRLEIAYIFPGERSPELTLSASESAGGSTAGTSFSGDSAIQQLEPAGNRAANPALVIWWTPYTPFAPAFATLVAAGVAYMLYRLNVRWQEEARKEDRELNKQMRGDERRINQKMKAIELSSMCINHFYEIEETYKLRAEDSRQEDMYYNRVWGLHYAQFHYYCNGLLNRKLYEAWLRYRWKAYQTAPQKEQAQWDRVKSIHVSESEFAEFIDKVLGAKTEEAVPAILDHLQQDMPTRPSSEEQRRQRID